jgi:hypothetical protein
MNAVEIEEAISALAEQPFDAAEFPFAFLQAFGNKETTLKRLRKGESNRSDLGGVLQTNNIHIAVCPTGEVTKTLVELRVSPATARAKAKFILATDGDTFEAEDLASGETVACAYADFPDHFGFFLPLAGITTIRQITENAFDIRATSRLNRLYVELLKDNPEWGTAARRHDMNHFMARLIFCFFAEDTDIFNGTGLFTATIEQMSARDSSNTHEVIGALFRAMNTPIKDRAASNLRPWADVFPYVNGGLFSGSLDVPRFSRIARSYLLHIGNLDWTKINPDIFGSMIQAVAEDEERGGLGLHYTSVPNILKVLNLLFLDELRARLDEAGDNPRMLLNLRRRLSRIRVFDPACGSGNFLVIAYKEMREIEAEINKRRRESGRKSGIPLTNFRGIELRDFPAEIARLALIIAEFQCDVLYRGQKEALKEFLPLDAQNWITCDNALRLDWLSVCPPTGTGVKHHADDLFHTPLDQPQIDFENEGGETYICLTSDYIIGDRNFALYDAPLWNMALIASRLHWVWIGTVCVRMRTDFSYSNTLGWNTFPVPSLTEKNKIDLTRSAENILIARETHFPASIADLYNPHAMPENLRHAHRENDEIIERIYFGRRMRLIPLSQVLPHLAFEEGHTRSRSGACAEFSGRLEPSCCMPVAVLRRRGWCRTVGTPLRGLSRPMISQ